MPLNVKSKFFHFLNKVSGRYAHLKPSAHCKTKRYGNNYGGFHICDRFLKEKSIIYSFGLGQHKQGFQISYVSPSFQEVSFIRKELLLK